MIITRSRLSNTRKTRIVIHSSVSICFISLSRKRRRRIFCFFDKKNEIILQAEQTDIGVRKITITAETPSEFRLSKSANKGGTTRWNPRGLKSMDGGEMEKDTRGRISDP